MKFDHVDRDPYGGGQNENRISLLAIKVNDVPMIFAFQASVH
jgi:hypothetical protein